MGKLVGIFFRCSYDKFFTRIGNAVIFIIVADGAFYFDLSFATWLFSNNINYAAHSFAAIQGSSGAFYDFYLLYHIYGDTV